MTAKRIASNLLFVHGAGGGGWEWGIWQEVFRAAGYRCRSPDLQPAAAGLAATSFADYQNQVQDWIAATPAPQILVGASLGALLLLKCLEAEKAGAGNRQGHRLVLLNPHPARPEAEQMPPFRDHHAGVIAWATDSRLHRTQRSLAQTDAASQLVAFRGWRNESSRVLLEARQQPLSGPITAPCLWLASRDDEDVPAGATESMVARLGGELMLLPGDHLSPMMGRAAAGVAARVLAWLSST